MHDLIIVGASFSGLMTAITASKGNKVLLIEKRKVPGTPINTTGAVPIEWIAKMGVFPPSDCIAGNLKGIEMVAPNGSRALVKNENPDGMVLYPDRFVKWLAARAEDLGCEVMTDTTFKGMSSETPPGGEEAKHRRHLVVSTNKGSFAGNYLVGADGTASIVGRTVGMGERPAPEDLHIGIEYTVRNDGIQDPEVYSLYLGHQVAPLGYAWSFPEGSEYLKIGLGIPQSTDLTAKYMMDKFLENNPRFKTAISKRNGGIIPTAPPLKTAVKGNVMLVGDAAHFCSPLHGGGIWFGMLSGQLAGKAILRGDPLLYDKLWKMELGGVLSRHYKLKKVIYGMSDKNFNDMVELLKTYARIRGSNPKLGKAAQELFFSSPGFLLEMAMKWSRNGLALDVIRRMLIPSFRIA